MWDRSGDDFWILGHNGKNLGLEGLWEHLLNSTHGCPMAFERSALVALEVGLHHNVANLFSFVVKSCVVLTCGHW